MNIFKGKGVVITGAASGIGEALARNLAARGARLLLADLHVERLDAVVAELRASGTDCLAQPCDVADPAALHALAGMALHAWGGADVVINNAGVGLVAPVHSLDLDDAHWLMDINFWGVVHGCRAFMPQLQARQGGVIVNISSIFAMVSMPTQSIYNASKAAVRGFSDALREELRDSGVRVLCVHPGGIQTRIAQQARLGDISVGGRHPAGAARPVRPGRPHHRPASGAGHRAGAAGRANPAADRRRCEAGRRALPPLADPRRALAVGPGAPHAPAPEPRLKPFCFWNLATEHGMAPAEDELNPAFRPRWYGVLALYLAALTVGAGSAWLAVRSQLDSGGVTAGVWRTSTLAGSSDADIYTRAVIAVGALLALEP